MSSANDDFRDVIKALRQAFREFEHESVRAAQTLKNAIENYMTRGLESVEVILRKGSTKTEAVGTSQPAPTPAIDRARAILDEWNKVVDALADAPEPIELPRDREWVVQFERTLISFALAAQRLREMIREAHGIVPHLEGSIDAFKAKASIIEKKVTDPVAPGVQPPTDAPSGGHHGGGSSGGGETGDDDDPPNAKDYLEAANTIAREIHRAGKAIVEEIDNGHPITNERGFWAAIRENQLSFASFDEFMKKVCDVGLNSAGKHFETGECEDLASAQRKLARRRLLPFPGTHPYNQLKIAAEIFMNTHCGVELTTMNALNIADRLHRPKLRGVDQLKAELKAFQKDGQLSYLDALAEHAGNPKATSNPKHKALYACLDHEVSLKLQCPCLIELIWSYWHEEAMLVQSMNAIALRFQNRRVPGRNPGGLSRMYVDALRPLNALLWGYIQDEQHRLTIARRAYEYDHHYGITLQGRAVPSLEPADSRASFLRAFHGLLFSCTQFYKQRDNRFVDADAFPVLNSLREVHQLLTDGGDNQWGDLPWTARLEMLTQQWILARPEMREVLRGRPSTAYPERWMETVDAVRAAQGWGDTSVTHFHRLATYGELLLLSIRYFLWNSTFATRPMAFNWADYWREEIQGYIHAYRAVTGVDLSTTVDATPPSQLLRAQLAAGI